MTQTNERSRLPPQIDAQFDHLDKTYAPGDPLTVRYRIAVHGVDVVRGIEHSIAWYTEGKGEEDMVVHAFERLGTKPADDATITGELTCRLPSSPLSYEGVIVKVRWCLRVRVFFVSGRDFVSEHVFTVGHLPPARPAAALSPAPAVSDVVTEGGAS